MIKTFSELTKQEEVKNNLWKQFACTFSLISHSFIHKWPNVRQLLRYNINPINCLPKKYLLPKNTILTNQSQYPPQVGAWRSLMPNLQSKNSYCCLPNAFVKMSASWALDGTNAVRIFPATISSRMKWQSISIFCSFMKDRVLRDMQSGLTITM